MKISNPKPHNNLCCQVYCYDAEDRQLLFVFWGNSIPEELLTEEEVELLTSPLDLAEYKSAITEAMFKGAKRNVESEEETPKNMEVG